MNDHPYASRIVAAAEAFERRVAAGRVAASEADRLPAGRRRTPEHDEQRVVVQWLRLRGHVVVAPLNGSRLSGSPHERARQWGRLVSLGASAGVVDLVTMRTGNRELLGLGGVVVAAVEMKAPRGGRVSPEQRDWHRRLAEVGCSVIVARGAAQAISELTALGF